MFSGRVYVATDHAGYGLAHTLIERLQINGVDVVDMGPKSLNKNDDYPDFIEPVAKQISESPHARAIVLGKTGEGEAMNANRLKGVRAAVFNGGPLEVVRLAREHNDANTLSLGAGFLTEDQAWEAVTLFLSTPFSGDERHIRRINKLDD